MDKKYRIIEVKFPDHIVGLAQAILEGQEVEEILADALMEIGLTHCADHFLRETPPLNHIRGKVNCCLLAQVLTGNNDVDTLYHKDFVNNIDMYNEVISYLKKIQ